VRDEPNQLSSFKSHLLGGFLEILISIIFSNFLSGKEFTLGHCAWGTMKLHVLSLKSGATELDVDDKETSIDTLKQKLFEASLIDVEPSQQRLIHAGRELTEHGLEKNRNLRALGVRDGHVIAVVKRRAMKQDKPLPRSSPEEFWRGMSYSKRIDKLMARAGSVVAPQTSTDPVEKDLQGRNVSDGVDSAQVGGDQQSVAQASGRSLGITLPEPDARAVEQLVEMGFPEARARKALLLHLNHRPAAMEWLLEVGDSPEADAELTDVQIRHIMNASTVHPLLRMRQEASSGTQGPDETVIQRLVDMGFAREEVLSALAATNNDYDAACTWLLGERGGAGVQQAQDGQVNDAPGAQGTPQSMQALLGNILTHPAIQQGMQSERVLQAFQAMIEDPSSAHDYLNDPEVGPILLRVHSILSRVADGQQGQQP